MTHKMTVHKLNESYSAIDAPLDQLQRVNDFLKVERAGAWFDRLVKMGFRSPYDYFGSIQNNKLVVMNGHLELLKSFGVEPHKKHSEFTEEEVDEFYNDIKDSLPFEPYDFQLTAFKQCLVNGSQISKMCTGSGKSYTISLLIEFLRRKGKRGVLLVPNINLLTQFHDDILSYGLKELYDDTRLIGGGSTTKIFDRTLVISTWQSLYNNEDIDLGEVDFIIGDESHRLTGEASSAVVKNSFNCKYKWGFTGTLPEDPSAKMMLIGLFGLPKTYITSRELIDRGLATPVYINAIHLNYNQEDRALFKGVGKTFSKQLQFVKEHEKRNELITNIASKLKGNSLVLGSHVEHLKLMYQNIMSRLYPDDPEAQNIPNKLITGKYSFEFQQKYGVYYISGTDDAKTREKTRKILEEEHYSVWLEDGTHLSIHEDDEITLVDGSKKLAKELIESDEIDDEWILHVRDKYAI